MKPGIIVLAAGSSSRLGQSKQMLDIHGEALLTKTVRAAIDSKQGPVVVVLGSDAHALKKLLSGFPIEIVSNESWKNGMGSSLKVGLRHLVVRHPSLQGIVALVCDQPLLTDKIITGLVDRYVLAKKPITASFYSGMPGVPVLFDKTYFSRLIALPDDQGAKKIILENPEDVSAVDFQGGEIDLDTMEDYNDFKKGEW